jgi:hypothetical protein
MDTPTKYPRCEGSRILIRVFPDASHKRGYRQDAIRCPGCVDCQPKKSVQPVQPLGAFRRLLAKWRAA